MMINKFLCFCLPSQTNTEHNTKKWNIKSDILGARSTMHYKTVGPKKTRLSYLSLLQLTTSLLGLDGSALVVLSEKCYQLKCCLFSILLHAFYTDNKYNVNLGRQTASMSFASIKVHTTESQKRIEKNVCYD